MLTVEFTNPSSGELYDDWLDPPVVPVVGDRVRVTLTGRGSVVRQVVDRLVGDDGTNVLCYVD
jgi:hypothetical protein